MHFRFALPLLCWTLSGKAGRSGGKTPGTVPQLLSNKPSRGGYPHNANYGAGLATWLAGTICGW